MLSFVLVAAVVCQSAAYALSAALKSRGLHTCKIQPEAEGHSGIIVYTINTI